MSLPGDIIMEMYGYKPSLNGIYILMRENVEIMRGTETEVWGWIHQNHSYSVGYAVKHGGYKILPEKE